MSFYSIFFWWLMGAISGCALCLFFGIWWWSKAVSRGIIAIKDNNGNWVGLDLPNKACSGRGEVSPKLEGLL